MDHQYNSLDEDWSDPINEEIINEIDSANAIDINISVPEKVGDDYLIELYRERRFLYDKRDQNFKDNEVKTNAWKEISMIMIKDKNLGDHYTAEYCKKRMTSLREQYVKLKKENNLKSGNGACSKKRSSLLSQLSFLNEYIQRKRTLTNIKENENAQISAVSRNKNASALQDTKIAESNLNLKKESMKYNLNLKRDFEASSSNHDTEYDSTEDSISYNKPRKIPKKISAKKSNENDDILRDLTNAAVNICTQLQSNSTSDGNVGSKSAELAFSEFIAFSLQAMEEPERSIRRNKIFKDLTASIDQLL